MASSHNQVELIGNLTADPQVKETPTGQMVATFSVATSRKWKDANGEVVEDTEFHNVVAWRKLAEIIEQYVVKGMKVFVKWYLKTRTWEKEVSGEIVKMYRTEIIADELIMLSSKDLASKKSKEEGESIDEAPRTQEAPRKRAKVEEEIALEDIPF